MPGATFNNLLAQKLKANGSRHRSDYPGLNYRAQIGM